MLMFRFTHERILAEGQSRAQEVIAKANADRDAALIECSAASARIEQHRRAARTIGRALREKIEECDVLNENLGRVSTALADANAVLDTAYVRDAKGRMQRYRAELGA